MQHTYGELLNPHIFLFYWVTAFSIFLCASAIIYLNCILFQFKGKYTLTYTFSSLLGIEILSLLLMDSNSGHFQLLLNIKVILALLLIPSIVLSSAALLEIKKIKYNSPVLHILLGILVLIPYVSIEFRKNCAFLLSKMNSGLLFSCLTPVFLLFVILCIKHINKKGTGKTVHNIIEKIDETVLIYDRQDKLCYSHISFNNIEEAVFITNIENQLIELKKVNGNNIKSSREGEQYCLKGQIDIMSKSRLRLSYKISPLFIKNKYMGKILLLSDMTRYLDLIEELYNKNYQLMDVLEAQKEHVQSSKDLAIEEERGRIMQFVNDIADDYLNGLKAKIARSEGFSTDLNEASVKKLKEENDSMIEMTRDTISKIRKTVKTLYI